MEGSCTNLPLKVARNGRHNALETSEKKKFTNVEYYEDTCGFSSQNFSIAF